MLYQETYSQVQNNGHMSEEFLLERGVRQGCPVSFPLYCVQNDVFSHHILKDKDIKGFNLPGKEGNLKLSQYADDTTLPARDVPWTSPESPLKVVTFGTSRGLSGDQHKN